MALDHDDDDLTLNDQVDEIIREEELDKRFSDRASEQIAQVEQWLNPIKLDENPTIH
jgi:hypothetical protein